MVNHFASLLANIDLRAIDTVVRQYELVFGGTSTISAAGGVLTVGKFTTIAENRLLLPLVDRNYNPITLPQELQRVYNVLFPATISTHYKQFLLYSYLRVVNSTDRADDVKLVDSRISYVLDDLIDYFKFRNISIIASNAPTYSLLVSGNGVSDENSRSFTAVYDVTQNSASTVLLYSPTQGLYYHPAKSPSKFYENMSVPVTPSADPLVSLPITINGTGLTCLIGGKTTFAATNNKAWRFSVDSPVEFNILDKIKTIDAYGVTVDNMFKYQQSICTQAYQNMWNMHFNPVYRLAGLLLAYVERVNLVWQKRAT
jgi:hypothetical protein